MTRDIASPLSRTEKKLETVLALSFERDTDDQPRRVRYLACRGEETMWRIEERRCSADWQTVDTERLGGLQLNLPDQAADAERQTDVGV
jgi:hypothetical protein